jgi:hypothetical protein
MRVSWFRNSASEPDIWGRQRVLQGHRRRWPGRGRWTIAQRVRAKGFLGQSLKTLNIARAALLGQDETLEPLKRVLIEWAEGNPFLLEESVITASVASRRAPGRRSGGLIYVVAGARNAPTATSPPRWNFESGCCSRALTRISSGTEHPAKDDLTDAALAQLQHQVVGLPVRLRPRGAGG